MHVTVRTQAYRHYGVEVNDLDTVGTIKALVHHESGIPPANQRLFFGGRELKDGWSISEASIREHSIILLQQNPVPGVVATAIRKDKTTHGKTKVEGSQVVSSAKLAGSAFRSPSISENEDEDEDEYILNPESHYRKIEALNDAVVKSSEYFRYHGALNRSDKNFDPVRSFSSLNCDSKVWGYINEFYTTISPDDSGEDELGFRNAFGSLAKSYLILCQVLDSLDLMTRKGFCESSYSIFVEHTNENVTELVRIESSTIRNLQRSVSDAINQIYEKSLVNGDEWSPRLRQNLGHPFTTFLNQLHLVPFKTYQGPTEPLFLCWLTAVLLDLGLVAYVGSHGSRFDLEYLGQDTPELKVNRVNHEYGFTCRLRSLACLEEFLDYKRVWVFHPWDLSNIAARSYKSDRALSVLAYMEDFADIWGPVWPIPAPPDFPDHVQQYNVSKGFIRRSLKGTELKVDEALSCHWYKLSSAPLWKTPISKDALIFKHDRLLIGALPQGILRENQTCTYRFDEYEELCGFQMTPLGTNPSGWHLDTRSVGFNASHYVGVSMVGTQKKLPQTSLKQHIWDTWSNDPERASARTLNQFLGVEISHCTGNARRIRIRDLFFIIPMRAYLDQQFPDWAETDYGSALLQALLKDEKGDVQNLWVEQYAKRPQIAELVCCMFSVLEKTGIMEGKFRAAFLNDGKELSMHLDLDINSWARFLQDTHQTAIYAIINEKCLECHAFGHFTSICSSVPEQTTSYTVFETQLAVASAQGFSQRLLLDQGGCLRKISHPDDSIVFMTFEPARLRELGDTFARLLYSERGSATKSREVRDQDELGGRKFRVCLKAYNASHGGLSRKRGYWT